MDNPYEAASAFAADFRHAEYSLKRSGYRRKHKEIAETDWESFANRLGAAFFAHVRREADC